MSKFAEYRPRAACHSESGGDREWSIRAARETDLEHVAALSAARDGQPVDVARAGFERGLAQGPERYGLFVAESEAGLAAYGSVAQLGLDDMPTGWYLTGVVVAPQFRRFGIGRALTQRRIAWLTERTPRVHYFAAIVNRASIDLHHALGFVEVRRDIVVPGCSFTGGVGALYRLDFD